MNVYFKHLPLVIAGFVLAPTLQSAETVLEGFGMWRSYAGTTYSENKDAMTTPIKPGGTSIGTRQKLKPGSYECSFEYKFANVPSGAALLTFACVTDHALYVNLTPKTEWTPVRFLVALTKEMDVKTDVGIEAPEANTLELRNFRLELLSAMDFAKIEYPSNKDLWFNRSSDRGKSALTEVDAADHVLGGTAVQVAAEPDFPKEGSLLLATIMEPLPCGVKFRLACWLKGDKEGTVRIAVGGHCFTERIGAKWKKIAFEFQRKDSQSPLTGLSFWTLDNGIRSLSVKNVELEMVK